MVTLIWQNRPLRRLLKNWTSLRGKRHMHNEHMLGTFQDMKTIPRIEKLFFNLPKLHRIKAQRKQRYCDLSGRFVALWNYQGAVRHESACSHELTTRGEIYCLLWKKLNQKKLNALVFWATSFQWKQYHHIPNIMRQLKMQKPLLTTNNLNRLLG